MSKELLDKTRKINKLLHYNDGYKISISDLVQLLGELLDSNIVIIDSEGMVIGFHEEQGIQSMNFSYSFSNERMITRELSNRLSLVLSTVENVNFSFLGMDDFSFNEYKTVINPIDICSERFGTVLTYRSKNEYDIDDILLLEYVATIVGLELLHDAYQEDVGEDQNDQNLKNALKALTNSELTATKYLFKELSYKDGLIKVSDISTKYKMTRSIIINAMKKLNGAGIIKSVSRGTRGTDVTINNEYIIKTLKAMDFDI